MNRMVSREVLLVDQPGPTVQWLRRDRGAASTEEPPKP